MNRSEIPVMLAIECPDILKIANIIVKTQFNNELLGSFLKKFNIAPETYSIEQLTMWGLYGNPVLESLSGHKWAYTEDTLCTLLLEAGFKDIHTALPRFHIPIRDFRVEAEIE